MSHELGITVQKKLRILEYEFSDRGGTENLTPEYERSDEQRFG